MLAFACLKCRQTTTIATIQSGKIVNCPHCDQQMRIVAEEPNSNVSLMASGDGLPAAAPPLMRRGPSPLAIGGSGLAGIGVAALLVLIWSLFGQGAASPEDSRIARHEATEPEPLPTKRPPIAKKPRPLNEEKKAEKPADPRPSKDKPKPPNDEPANESIAALIQMLSSPDSAIRLKGVRAIADKGANTQAAVLPLLELARNPKEKDDVRNEAQSVLLQIGGPPKSQLAVLKEALRDERYPPIRTYAAVMLGRAGESAAGMVGELVKATNDSDGKVRASVALALGKLGDKVRSEVMPDLRRMLNDKEVDVRRDAYQSLMQLIVATPSDAEVFRAMLADRMGFPEKRRFAAHALRLIGKEHAPALAEALSKEQESSVMEALCNELGKLKVRSQEICQALGQALSHSELMVREAACEALLQFEFHPQSVLPILKAMTGDDDPITRLVCQKMPEPSAYNKKLPEFTIGVEKLEELKLHLRSPSAAARLCAAYLIGTMGEDAQPALTALQKAMDKELDLRVQVEMIHSLGRMGARARDALAAVARLMNDTDPKKYLVHLEGALGVLRIESKDEGMRRDAYKVLVLALDVGDENKLLPLEHELFDQSKTALESGGLNAARAVVDTFNLRFFGPNVAMKFKARERCCKVLERIGPDAFHSDVRTMLTKEIRSFDADETKQAATAAWMRIGFKNR